MTNSLKIAHLTDLHFSYFNWNLNQLLSKQWLGNLNLFLFRKKALNTEHLWKLIDLFDQLKPEAICITGDFATTSLIKEFTEALKFVTALREKFPVFIIPGNHDYYTKKSERNQLFYKIFSSESQIKSSLQQDRIECSLIKEDWWWVGIDNAVATSIFSSHGEFFPQTGEILEKVLNNIPKKSNIIIGNHFPLFSTGRPKHDLKNADLLQATLKKFPQIKVYLHGHDHASYIIDRQEEGLPLSLNPGTCSLMGDGSFYLLDLTSNSCTIQNYRYQSKSWALTHSKKLSISKKISSNTNSEKSENVRMPFT